MEKKKIEELIAKYNEGLADPSELQIIESLIESGELDLAQLDSLNQIEERFMKMESPSPSMNLDDKFYTMLAAEKVRQRSNIFSFSMPNWQQFFTRYAFAMVLIVASFFVGYFIKSPSSKTEVNELTEQVSELKELMMLSMLEKESATERLKAVSLTSEMDQVSQKVTTALFKTLNEDENVNVRLAALEALKAYVRDNTVREGLVQSIALQESPLVQLALAELMVNIQEKQSVKELQKLLKGNRTPKEVKAKIEESIKVLI